MGNPMCGGSQDNQSIELDLGRKVLYPYAAALTPDAGVSLGVGGQVAHVSVMSAVSRSKDAST